MVQVKRDADESAMSRIKIIFTFEGDSYSSLVVAPGPNQMGTYAFNLSDYSVPEYVSVAPIFIVGKVEREGSVPSKVRIPKGVMDKIPTVLFNLTQDYQEIRIIDCTHDDNCTSPGYCQTGGNCIDDFCNYDDITLCTTGDNCCPVGCTVVSDDDCSDSCLDGIQNQGEELIDCGGPCSACLFLELDYMEYSSDANAQAAYKIPIDLLSGYSTRKKITIDYTLIDSTLSSFPVLVKLTSSNFDFSKVNDDGFDIRFTSSDGTTLLKYEREQHDSSGQNAEYWVKIPTISSSIDTDFYIYYQIVDTVDGADSDNVWDSNFQGVYHMTDLNDDSGYDRDGITIGTMVQAEGKIYKSQYDNDNYNSRINLGNDTYWNLDIMTLEISGELTSGDTYINKDWGSGYSLYMDDSNHASMALTDQINGHKVIGTTDVKDNFHYIVGTYDGSTIKLFVGGISEGTPHDYLFTYSGFDMLYIGGNNYGGGATGYWDEVRISNIVRSSSWIKASYYSGNDELLTYWEEDPLQPYSESIINQQGSYSLKVMAKQTDSLNDNLIRTVSPTINLSIYDIVKLDVQSNIIGSNFKINIHDLSGTTSEYIINVVSVNIWQTESWDISRIPNADKDEIDSIEFTILNADKDNIFYIDNLLAIS